MQRFSLAARTTLALDQLLGVFFILLAAALVWQRPSPMTWGFFLYGLWFNPGQTYVAYAILQRHPALFLVEELSQALAQTAGYIGFLIFALCFPDNAVASRWRPVWRSLPYLAAGLAALQLLSYGATFGFRAGAVSRAGYLVGYALQLLVVEVLWSRLRSQTPQDRQRTRWVILSCFVGLPAFLLVDSIESTSLWGTWTLPGPVADLLYLLSAGIAVAVYHAVRWHRVVDVRFAASRAATLLATWTIIAVLIDLAQTTLEHRFVAAQLQGVSLIVLAVCVAMLFDQLQRRLNRLCDQLFFRRLHEAEAHLRRVEDALAHGDSPSGIDQLCAIEAAAALCLEAAAVLARRADGSFARRSAGVNWPAAFPVLPAEDPLAARLATAGKSVRLAQMVWPPQGLPPDAPRPALALPFLAHRTLAAIGFYGAHVTGDDLNAEEVSMLEHLGRATAAAYDHVEVRLLRRRLGELHCEWQSASGT